MNLREKVKGMSDRDAVTYLLAMLEDEDALVAEMAMHVKATPKALCVLAILFSNRECLVTRDHLLARLEDDYDFTGDQGALRVHMTCLRKALAGSGLPVQIETVRGIGYILRTPPDWVAPWQKETA